MKDELKSIRQQQQQPEMAPPISVQSLFDDQLRQEFRRRQSELMADYQSKMKHLFDQILSQHYRELKVSLDDLLREYKHVQQDIHATLHLTPTMISTLDQILLLISDKVAAASQSRQQQAAIALLFSN